VGETESWRTLPNLLTALRILLIVPFGYYAVHGQDINALVIFVIAGLTDTLDGTLARWLNQRSKLGRLVDPIADKFLTGIAYIILSLFRDGRPAIPTWLMAAVIARDILILSGSWLVYRIAQTTAFQPTIFGKLNTLIELSVIAGFLGMTYFPEVASVMPVFYVVTAVSILVSFSGYARQGIQMIQTAKNRYSKLSRS
jgi:cardiolipin synthase